MLISRRGIVTGAALAGSGLSRPAGALPAIAPLLIRFAQPVLSRTYLCFFDWDSVELSQRAQRITYEAALFFRQTPAITRMEIAGHADRSGPLDHNMRLSRRRAAAVAELLRLNGVPADRITGSAFGETRPLVPTEDGVQEPQNRRVELVHR